MELRLKGLGTVEIIDATRVTGDDILVKSAHNFNSVAAVTNHKITEIYLTEVDFKWSLVACLDVPEDAWYEENHIVFHIENQEDVYNLKALL